MHIVESRGRCSAHKLAQADLGRRGFSSRCSRLPTTLKPVLWWSPRLARPFGRPRTGRLDAYSVGAAEEYKVGPLSQLKTGQTCGVVGTGRDVLFSGAAFI